MGTVQGKKQDGVIQGAGHDGTVQGAENTKNVRGARLKGVGQSTEPKGTSKLHPSTSSVIFKYLNISTFKYFNI